VDGLHAADSLDRLERRVEKAWRDARAEDPGAAGTEWMVRVVLHGPSPLWRELRTEENRDILAQELREVLGALEVVVQADGVHPVVTAEEHRTRPDVLGETLRLLEKVRAGEAEIEDLPSTDLAGAPSDDPQQMARYLRRLLEDVDGEVVARMLGAAGEAGS
jgi:hypothetical protein